MVFSLSIDFIEELLLQLIKFLIEVLLSRTRAGLHFLDLLLEHLEEFLGQ